MNFGRLQSSNRKMTTSLSESLPIFPGPFFASFRVFRGQSPPLSDSRLSRATDLMGQCEKMSPDADIKRKSGIHLQNYAHAKLETA